MLHRMMKCAGISLVLAVMACKTSSLLGLAAVAPAEAAGATGWLSGANCAQYPKTCLPYRALGWKHRKPGKPLAAPPASKPAPAGTTLAPLPENTLGNAVAAPMGVLSGVARVLYAAPGR